VEEQLVKIEEQHVENNEEELLERARKRRLAIMQKHQSTDSIASPTTPPPAVQTPTQTAEPMRPSDLTPQESNTSSPRSSPDSPKTPVDASSNSKPSDASTSNKPSDEPSTDMFDMFSATPVTISPTRGPSEHPIVAITNTEIQTDKEGYIMIKAGELLGERYLVGATCGSGMFSKVLRAKDTQDNNKEVVVKVIRDNDFMKRVGIKEVEYLQKLREADPEGTYACIQLLNHFKDRDLFCLVFEAQQCNLRELIHKYGSGTGFHLKAVQVYARKVLLALYLLKQLNLIHADLKPDNILVNENKTSVKLSDFGSVLTYNEAQTMRGATLVSGWYRAPEIILGLTPSYDIDMWSAGCSIYEMVTGKIMFAGGVTNNELLKNQMEVLGEIPRKVVKKAMFRNEYFDDQFNFLSLRTDPVTGSHYSQAIKITHPTRDLKSELLEHATEEEKKHMNVLHDLLVKMLAFDPTKRLKIEEALQHPFFGLKL
jgi:serine/threonine-protein kinase PRP4